MSGREDVPLVDVLYSIECELSELGQLAHRVQDVISSVILSEAATDIDKFRDAQALDLLAQRVFGLAQFLRDFAPELPTAWRADPTRAASSVTVLELSRRLALAPHAPIQGYQDEAESGDFEMF